MIWMINVVEELERIDSLEPQIPLPSSSSYRQPDTTRRIFRNTSNDEQIMNYVGFSEMSNGENQNLNSIEDISSHPAYAKFLNNTILNYEGSDESHFHLMESYKTNRRLSEPYFTLLILAYSLLIIFGSIGNSLVVSAVIRKPGMRTARNLFVINLAVSDLLLCLITMPLTLMEILSTYWPLPSSPFLCKVVGSLQGVCVFVDIISITSIALDRYQVIVYPTNQSLQRLGAVLVLVGIWMLSCLLAAPLFIWRTLRYVPMDFPHIGLNGVEFCLEEWPTDHGRAYYSIFTIIFQYFVPVTIISFAYLGICKKLRYRMRPGGTVIATSNNPPTGGSNPRQHPNIPQQDQRRDSCRVRRTNILLISIAVIFGISWMPLNVLNVIADVDFPFSDHKETYIIVYAICHMAGMSSACSNPLLYGWLNENFRKEFKEIWIGFKACCCRRRRGSDRRIETGEPIESFRRGHHHPVANEATTVLYRKTKQNSTIEDDGDIEQSTLITQVLK